MLAFPQGLFFLRKWRPWKFPTCIWSILTFLINIWIIFGQCLSSRWVSRSICLLTLHLPGQTNSNNISNNLLTHTPCSARQSIGYAWSLMVLPICVACTFSKPCLHEWNLWRGWVKPSLYRLVSDCNKKTNFENCIQNGEAPPRRRSPIKQIGQEWDIQLRGLLGLLRRRSVIKKRKWVSYAI